MKTIYKDESFILFSCILIIIVVYFMYYLCKTLTETFGCNTRRGSNNSKRAKMIKIYKNDDISDPDENPDDEENNDPDSTFGIDPD